MKPRLCPLPAILILVSIWAVCSAVAQPETMVPGAAPYDLDVGQSRVYWSEVAVEACAPPYTLNWVYGLGATPTVQSSGCTLQATELRTDGYYAFFIDAATRTLQRISSYGGYPVTIASTPGMGFTGPGNLALNGSYIYWGDDTGLHRRTVYLGSETPRNLSSAPAGYHNDHFWLAVDGTNIYWVDGAAGNRGIYRMPVTGGAITPLIASLTRPEYLAVDNLYLYWADAGARIFRMPKGGGGWTSYNSANTNFQATGLVVDNTYVYWSQSGPPLTDSVMLRRCLKNSAAVEDLLIGRNAGYLRQDSSYLYWRDNDGIKRLRKDSSAFTIDFSLQAIEVTQGTQNLLNNVPLVADKQTFVRVYPGAQLTGIAGQSTTAILRGTRNGVALPASPLQPVTPNLNIVNHAGIDRANVTNSFLFALPPSWLSNTVVLTAEINPARALPETSYANNTITVTNTFTRKAMVGVYVVPVVTRDAPGSVFTIRDPAYRQILRRFVSMYPTARAYTQPLGGVSGPWNLPGDMDAVLVSFMARYLLSAEFNDGAGGPGDKHHVMGMVSSASYTSNTTGYANFCVPVSWVKMVNDTNFGAPFSAPSGGATMAQELVHNYNGWPYWPTEATRWQHIPCGTANQINPNYPYPPNQIGTVGTNNAYGFDSVSLTAVAPDGASDFMSYCGPAWVSDYTWRGLFDELPTASSSVRRTPDPTPLTGNPILFISGELTADGSFQWFEPAYNLEASLLNAQRFYEFVKYQQSYTFTGATYTLDQLDINGKILVSQPFEPMPPEEHEGAVEHRPFCLAVPVDPGTRKVQLAAKGTPLLTRALSPNAPIVTVTSPKSGTYAVPILLSWIGKDADGDPLTYSVQFSSNGGSTWQLLAYNVTGNSITQEVANLPGSTNCYFRVIASDGMNTGYALSPRFSISPHAPLPFLDSPMDGQIFRIGQQLILNGDGYDFEDGNLPDTSLSWYVDAIGYVGSGRNVVVPGLPPGAYQVRLDAVDSAKNLTSASVRILVTQQGRPPELVLAPGQKDVLISWPFSAEDYVLETTDQLAPPKWVSEGSTPVLIDGMNTVSAAYGPGSRFYRLRNIRF